VPAGGQLAAARLHCALGKPSETKENELVVIRFASIRVAAPAKRIVVVIDYTDRAVVHNDQPARLPQATTALQESLAHPASCTLHISHASLPALRSGDALRCPCRSCLPMRLEGRKREETHSAPCTMT
jgi:hypothetical protein